ncbi:MAG: sigma 54-interacting transcriptional regulator [Gammaproteobacteria bacterium]
MVKWHYIRRASVMAAQAKLLRVMGSESSNGLRVPQTVKVDVRLIAASNRDLLAMVKEGSSRPDLYYRLNVFPISVSALRARTEDILPLASVFFSAVRAQTG